MISYRLRHLKKLSNENKIPEMIEFMNSCNIDEVKFVFEVVSKKYNPTYLYLYALKTDYQIEVINKLYKERMNYIINNKKLSGLDVSIQADDIFSYARDVKKANVLELIEVLKNANSVKNLYLIWLYLYSTYASPLVDDILEYQNPLYNKLIYENFSKHDKIYALNYLAPKIINDKIVDDDHYNTNLEMIKEDINSVKDDIAACYNLELDDLNIEEVINIHLQSLNRIKKDYQNNNISKKEVIALISADVFPNIGLLKMIGFNKEQIIEVLSSFPNIEIVKDRCSDTTEYMTTDFIVDAIYNYLKIKEVNNVKVKEF